LIVIKDQSGERDIIPARRRIAMHDIKVDETLWASSILPEGVVKRWFIASGDTVKVGERIAEVRIEDALHEIVAPANGRATIVATANTVVEPGTVLATLDDTLRPG
jgi:pyruvate/2-oxoglutarate dehydrogenase complex dihydrolipoamide acyltransferase (E2) component